MKDRAIICERLNVVTLCFAVLARPRFRNIYFYEFAPFIKKRLFRFTKRMGLKQISHLGFLESAIEPKGSKKAIELGNEILKEYPSLSKALVSYLGDPRAEGLMKQTFVFDLAGDAHKYVLLAEFARTKGHDVIYYFPVRANFVSSQMGEIYGKVTVIRWHLPILNIVRLAKGTVSFALLLLAPPLLFLKLAVNGKIEHEGEKKEKPLARKIIFIHRFEDIHSDSSKFFRFMYLFNCKALEIKDCIHMCITKSFTSKKISHLKKEGGLIFDYASDRISQRRIRERLFRDYYRSFLPNLHLLAFNRFSSIRMVKDLIMLVSTAVKFEGVLEKMDARLAIFENEMGYSPSVFTITANKKNIETMTMMHGVEAYCFSNYGRANSIVNHYLVPGAYYDRFLKQDNPDIGKFYPVGNHEIEEFHEGASAGLNRFRGTHRKILGVLANFYWPIFPDSQSLPYSWPLFDKEDALAAFRHYWLPVFKWLGKRDDIFIIFKGKMGYGQYNHPYLKEAMSYIPKDRYYQNDDVLMKEVIEVSDYTLCSANSSALYSSLCRGVKAITYSLSSTGYVAAAEHCEYIAAHNPDDFIRNFEHMLEQGISMEAFDRIRRDHDVVDELGNRVSVRIKRLIEKFISDRGGNDVITEVNANIHHIAGEDLFARDDSRFKEYRKKWEEWPKNFYAGEFPLFIDVETTSACNLKCPFCATTYRGGGVKKGFVTFDIVKKIIDEGAERGLYGVKYNIRGEPLLHPQICDFVGYAKKKGLIDVYFNTNAMLLTEEISRRLIDSGLDRISISIEGHSKEVYEKYRVGAKFDIVVSNIERLQYIKKNLGVSHPKIRVQSVMLPELKPDFGDYKKFWEKLADEVAFLDYKEMKGKHKGISYPWACPQIWQRMAVWWDGTILPCNHDDGGLLGLGNVMKNNIKECWQSAKLKEIRDLHRKGTGHNIAACDGCYLRDSEIAKITEKEKI